VRPAPGIPCALWIEGDNDLQDPDASCRGNAKVRLRSPLSSPGLTGGPSTLRPLGSITAASGILDRPVKPGDDTEKLFEN